MYRPRASLVEQERLYEQMQGEMVMYSMCRERERETAGCRRDGRRIPARQAREVREEPRRPLNLELWPESRAASCRLQPQSIALHMLSLRAHHTFVLPIK